MIDARGRELKSRRQPKTNRARLTPRPTNQGRRPCTSRLVAAVAPCFVGPLTGPRQTSAPPQLRGIPCRVVPVGSLRREIYQFSGSVRPG